MGNYQSLVRLSMQIPKTNKLMSFALNAHSGLRRHLADLCTILNLILSHSHTNYTCHTLSVTLHLPPPLSLSLSLSLINNLNLSHSTLIQGHRGLWNKPMLRPILNTWVHLICDNDQAFGWVLMQRLVPTTCTSWKTLRFMHIYYC